MNVPKFKVNVIILVALAFVALFHGKTEEKDASYRYGK
jgi:hypothetical protein